MKINKLATATVFCGVLSLATFVFIHKMDSKGEPGAVAAIESGVDISDRVEVVVLETAGSPDKGIQARIRLKNISDVPLLNPLS
ncbi:MAG TPA: hypothetical protein VFX02_06595, partial [Gammaproteobacteria bacterium]|nr:hypothetical protein [Gammaproteobacteria bacterium]